MDLGAGAVHRLRARHQDLARLRVTLLERRVQGVPVRVDRPGRVRRPSFSFQRLSLLRQQTNPTDQNSETTDRAVARTYLVWVTARAEHGAHVMTTPHFISLTPGGDRRRVETVVQNIRY